MNDILQIKISLNFSNPLIWRVVQLNNEITLFEFHHIIQITMGWQCYHLYEFNVKGYRIGEIDDNFKGEGFGNDELLNSRTIKLKDILDENEEPFLYLYDFGDSWKHTIEMEKTIQKEPKNKYPICIDGEMHCPPEDCGGIHSYYNYLDILKDKKHEEYKEIRTWIGKKFDPNAFDKDAINRKLKNLKKYILK